MYGFLPRLSTRLETMAAAVPVPLLRRDRPAEPALPLALDGVTDAETFEAITEPAADIIANGRLTKFLIDARDAASPRLYVINANFTRNGATPDAARFHFAFASEALGIPESLEEFNRLTYFTPGQKRYIAGVVHSAARELSSLCWGCSSTRRT